MANNVTLLLPTPTINVIGAVSNVQLSGSVTLKLPVPRLGIQATNVGTVLTLPTPVLAVRGNTAQVAAVNLLLPVPRLVAKGEVTTVGSVTLILPTPALRAASPDVVGLVLPVPRFSASGKTGRIGNVQLVLPVPVCAATGRVPFTSTVGLVLPKPLLSVAGLVGNVGRMANTLRGIALAVQGATGEVGRVTLTLPISGNLQNDYVGGLSASGFEQERGSVTLTLPMLILQSTGQTSAVVSGDPDGNVLPAIVIQTETGALTQYTNYPFNSMAKFNGVYLGASAEGLFVLTGDTDNTAFINAAARVGITDFGTSFLKRIDRCYVGYRTSGDLVVRVFTDEIHIRDYLITAYGKAGLHGNHTRIGKGLAARYWQFEILNRNGCDFELNALELKPTHLRRRIGGGDA